MFSFFHSAVFLNIVFFRIRNIYWEISLLFICEEFHCLFQNLSGFISFFPKFSFILLATTYNQRNVKISNVGRVTHIGNLSRFYLHKQSLETPIHVDSPPFLRSRLLIVTWRFIPRRRVFQKCLFKIRTFHREKFFWRVYQIYYFETY